MNENVKEELVKINTKLDIMLTNQNVQGNRITKLEVEAGFIRGGFTLIIAVVTAAVAWAFKKVFDNA